MCDMQELNEFKQLIRGLFIESDNIYKSLNFSIAEIQTINSAIGLLDLTMDTFVRLKKG